MTPLETRQRAEEAKKQNQRLLTEALFIKLEYDKRKRQIEQGEELCLINSNVSTAVGSEN